MEKGPTPEGAGSRAGDSRLKYDEWLADFVKDKKEVATSGDLSSFALHDVRRYIDGKNHIWEIAFTFTGRLVIRSGVIAADGINIEWENWATRHDIEISKQR